jgi:hypothetical protein
MSTGKQVSVIAQTGHPESVDVPESAAGRLKRMMFVASLYFRLRGVKDPTRAELDEVNQRFHLVQDNRALRFPAACSNMIWGKLDLPGMFAKYKAGNASMSALAMEVLNEVPRWMKYGDGRALRQDMQAVFESVRRH